MKLIRRMSKSLLVLFIVMASFTFCPFTLFADGNASANNEADFEIKLTDDANGSIITKYKGARKDVIVPATIQGLPVVEVGGIKGVETAVIPEGVKRISAEAFGSNWSGSSYPLKSVHLPEGLEVIGDYAFYQCNNLTSVNFPSTLKAIGVRAFGKTKLGEVTLSEGLEVMGRDVFVECKELTAISLPKSLYWVMGSIAKDCNKLEQIDIPDGISLRVRDFDKMTFEFLFSGTKIRESITLQRLLKTHNTMPFVDDTSDEQYHARKQQWKDIGDKYGISVY